jgi:type II secretion system protein H
VSGHCKQGFTFIEILVVMMLVGILATIIVPNLGGRLPKYEREAFIAELEGVIRFGWQEAVQSTKMHRVLFDLEKNKIAVQVATGKKNRDGTPAFDTVADSYTASELIIPDAFEFREFYINGRNELKRDRDTFKVWFFILPTGMTQEVVINMLDTNESDAQGNEMRVGLVLNPFTAQLKIYDTFQKP